MTREDIKRLLLENADMLKKYGSLVNNGGMNLA
jgi:hypothetical protein